MMGKHIILLTSPKFNLHSFHNYTFNTSKNHQSLYIYKDTLTLLNIPGENCLCSTTPSKICRTARAYWLFFNMSRWLVITTVMCNLCCLWVPSIMGSLRPTLSKWNCESLQPEVHSSWWWSSSFMLFWQNYLSFNMASEHRSDSSEVLMTWVLMYNMWVLTYGILLCIPLCHGSCIVGTNLWYCCMKQSISQYL